MARCVDQDKLGIAVREPRLLGIDRDPASSLHFVVVKKRGPLIDPPETPDGSGQV